MFWQISALAARPLIRGWLKYSTDSWRNLAKPLDWPRVHSPGANPDRLLLAGDGAVAGWGVLAHELSLAGYLARRITVVTGRAVDVDIVAGSGMTAALCLQALSSLDFSRFDAVVVSVGTSEALGLAPLKRWRRDMEALIDRIESDALSGVETFVLSVPPFGSNGAFPRILARLVDAHTDRLNRITGSICLTRPHTTFIETTPSDSRRYRGAGTYERLAMWLAPLISTRLAPPSGLDGRLEEPDELGRQLALTSLGILDTARGESFDLITAAAQNLFGVPMAAVTFIDKERQWFKSAQGLPGDETLRSDAFCDITIRRATHFVVEDTTRDPRFVANPFTTGPTAVRFYAGYPIESPDGHRIGALCIMDHQPREFTTMDASLLRDLALRVQDLVWGAAPPLST